MEKKRLSINLNCDLYDKLKREADSIGISSASMASIIVATYYGLVTDIKECEIDV